MEQLRTLLNLVFPNQIAFNRNLSFIKRSGIFLATTLLITAIVSFLPPPNGFVGFDWVNIFSKTGAPPFYPPWTDLVLNILSWPLLIGITIGAFTTMTLERAVHPFSAVAAFLCLPLFWTIFLGQLEGISLFGLLFIPWLAPLILIKPQITVFAFLNRKRDLLVLGIFLLISLMIWKLWPAKVFAVESFYGEGRYQQNIGLGLWGMPIALVLLWFSRGDMDLLMLAGSFALYHLIPYNLLPVIPAVARLKPGQAWLCVLFSWLPFASNWIGPMGWWSGWIFVLFLWLSVFRSTYPERIPVFLKP